jgi:hypothetical protein
MWQSSFLGPQFRPESKGIYFLCGRTSKCSLTRCKKPRSGINSNRRLNIILCLDVFFLQVVYWRRCKNDVRNSGTSFCYWYGIRNWAWRNVNFAGEEQDKVVMLAEVFRALTAVTTLTVRAVVSKSGANSSYEQLGWRGISENSFSSSQVFKSNNYTLLLK